MFWIHFLNTKLFLTFCRFNVFKAENIQRSIFPFDTSKTSKELTNAVYLNIDSSFAFSRFCDWIPQEMEDTHLKSTFYLFQKQNSFLNALKWLEYAEAWVYPISTRYLLLSVSISLKINSIITPNRNLFFISWVSLRSVLKFDVKLLERY